VAHRHRERLVSAEQIPVLVYRDRSGGTFDYVVEKDNARHISSALKPVLASDCSCMPTAVKLLALPREELALHIRIAFMVWQYVTCPAISFEGIRKNSHFCGLASYRRQHIGQTSIPFWTYFCFAKRKYLEQHSDKS